MSDQDLKTWLPTMWEDYRQSLVDTGFTSEEATLNIGQNEQALFIDGAPNDDQHFFDVMDDATKVGTLWLATREKRNSGEWFVYDIEFNEEFRGNGFGRSTMQGAEDYVKGQGGTRLALNVFGPNLVARSLYESMGYNAMAIGMRKDLI
jgi:ribosomal protein S18 acetylase RimI-like enzyme